jgi:ornithine carbamoyltransferase
MSIATPTRHVLRIADLDARELEAVLDLAARMKATPTSGISPCTAARSRATSRSRRTPTRVSLEAAR